MLNLNNIKTIFFDYDGTIHNGLKIYVPAFMKAYNYLVDKGLTEPKEFTEDEVSYWLGFNPKEMWQKFMPQINEDDIKKCSEIISGTMESLTIDGKAELYKDSLNVLSYLKDKGYNLIFISNCKIYYKEAHKKIFGLDKYFDKMVSSEEYDFIPKHEVLKSVMKEYPMDMVIVGDRFHDIEAGRINNIYTIGCSYGYGSRKELEGADLVINNILELKELL